LQFGSKLKPQCNKAMLPGLSPQAMEQELVLCKKFCQLADAKGVCRVIAQPHHVIHLDNCALSDTRKAPFKQQQKSMTTTLVPLFPPPKAPFEVFSRAQSSSQNNVCSCATWIIIWPGFHTNMMLQNRFCMQFGGPYECMHVLALTILCVHNSTISQKTHESFHLAIRKFPCSLFAWVLVNQTM